jgi:hypothetical protein
MFNIGDRVALFGRVDSPNMLATVLDEGIDRILVKFDSGNYSKTGTWFSTDFFIKIKSKKPDWRI